MRENKFFGFMATAALGALSWGCFGDLGGESFDEPLFDPPAAPLGGERPANLPLFQDGQVKAPGSCGGCPKAC